MSGGVLICGDSSNNTSLYFVRLNYGSGLFSFHGVELKFSGQMNSVVYVEGGICYFERVKINMHLNKWVSPLIEVYATTSSVIIQFHSTNITESYYISSSLSKSAVIYFSDTNTQVINLNISSSFFINNTFYISDKNSANGAFCYFHGPTDSSLFFFFILFCIFVSCCVVLTFIFFFFFLLALLMDNCIFVNCSEYSYFGGFFFFFFCTMIIFAFF
jgi:hypothetical protein